VTIPLIALGFIALGYGLVRGARGALDVKTAASVFATEDGATGKLVTTVTSGAGGSRTIGFGSPVAGQSWFEGNAPRGGAVTQLTAEGAEVLVETSPFSVGVAYGAVDSFEGFLAADLVWDGRRYSGEVVNRTPHDVTEAGIAIGREVVELGDIEAGGSVPVDFPRRNPVVERLSGGIRGALLTQVSSLPKMDLRLRTPLVYGYAEGYETDLTIDGVDASEVDQLLLTSPVNMRVLRGTSGVIPEWSGITQVIKLDGFVYPNDQRRLIAEQFTESVLVHRLPASIDRRRIARASVNLLSRGSVEAQVFDFERQRWVATAAGPGRIGGEVPAGSVSEGGEIYIRLTPRRHRFMMLYHAGAEVELRPKGGAP
ncbi:MAG: hypothetical protein ACRDJ5_00240, partial [Actinomycetota bacterium]